MWWWRAVNNPSPECIMPFPTPATRPSPGVCVAHHLLSPSPVHTQQAEGAMDAANLLKPMLARGELRTIGATTLAEYRQHIEKDAAFERRFQQVRSSISRNSRTYLAP